ncbi:MAG TPA: hypothetical protein VH458_14785, partial [Vicinamibacterales bacterium]
MIHTSVGARPSLSARFGAFVLERYPFARKAAVEALNAIGADELSRSEAIDGARARLGPELRRRFADVPEAPSDPTPGIPGASRWSAAIDDLVSACDGFLRRAAIEASLTADERREILRGMALTRATDNRLKALFTSGDVRFGDAPFQGKGFRSLGQEAIYATAIRFRRGPAFQHEGGWRGDVIAPLIRDLGAVLAMSPHALMVRAVLSAQMAKAGPPMDGKDLHVGDFGFGILPPAAPLAIGALTIAG